MNNFTALKFDKFWNAIRDFVNKNWSVGRERKFTYSGSDMQFMSPCDLKHIQQ